VLDPIEEFGQLLTLFPAAKKVPIDRYHGHAGDLIEELLFVGRFPALRLLLLLAVIFMLPAFLLDERTRRPVVVPAEPGQFPVDITEPLPFLPGIGFGFEQGGG
jgi:hypothetical protein